MRSLGIFALQAERFKSTAVVSTTSAALGRHFVFDAEAVPELAHFQFPITSKRKTIFESSALIHHQ
jgi:hypothetical protein